MKVAVKKNVLFNLLKKHLNENRMSDNSGGRVIHPFNIQSPNSDPFGYYEDEAPIKPSSHMATQLSIAEPPVEDEDYVPSTINELCAASVVIAKEVPIDQIEFFYRKLHLMLDEALDKEDGFVEEEMINEAFNISKSTTISDYDMLSESSRLRVRRASDDTTEALPSEIQPEDYDSYNNASNRDEWLRGYNFAADFEVEGKSEDELEEHDSYVGAQSIDFKTGYDKGNEVATGIKPTDYESNRPLMPSIPGVDDLGAAAGTGRPLYRNFQQFMTRQGIKDVMGKSYEDLDPFQRAVYDLSDEIQLLFKQIDAEFTSELMNPDLKKEFGAMMKPLTHQYQITPNTVLNPIKVKSIFAAANRIKDPARRNQKLQDLLMTVYKRIYGILEEMISTNQRIKRMIAKLAREAGTPFDVFVQSVAESISADYANYGVSTRFDSAEDIINNKITTTFSSWVKTINVSIDSEEKFKNQTHFLNNVNLDAESDFKDMFFEVVESQFKKSNDEFEFKDSDSTVLVTPEEAREYSDGHVAGAFEMARSMRPEVESDEDIDSSEDIKAELTEEEKYVKRVEKYAQMIATGKSFDWQDLFPYFGFSNVSGIRQWYLKKIQPKIDLFSYSYKDPDTGEKIRASINDLYDQNMELLIDAIEVSLKTIVIPDLEAASAKGKLKTRNYDAKKNKLKEVDQLKMLSRFKNEILPEVEAINANIKRGASFSSLVDDTEFLSTFGGWIIRTVGSYPLDSLISEFSFQWAEEIKGIINQIRKKHNPEAGSDLSTKQLDSVVEYFTGLKGDPDFENKNKAAKNLLNMGITPEGYIEIAVSARNIWEDLESQMDETFEGAELADKMIDEVDALLDNQKEMAKAIKKAYKESVQEIQDATRQRQAGL